MKKTRTALGVLLLIAAAALLLEKLDIISFTVFKDIGIFKLILALFFILAVIDRLVNGAFADIPIPLALLCIIFSKPLGLEAITPWPVLIVALLIEVALVLLLPGQKSLISYQRTSAATIGSTQLEGEDVSYGTVLGSGVKYVISDSLNTITLKVTLGDMDIFVDQAKLKSDTLNININQHFGTLHLYIPRDWEIDNRLHSKFSDIGEDGEAATDPSATVILNGRLTGSTLTVTRV